jgi:hypothetical protein
VTLHARIPGILAAGLFLLAVSAAAQVQFGDLRMSMNGTVAPGYSATSGNQPGSSSHDFTFGGASTLTGSYHSPNFFSFNSNLYLNQSRANSNFQSISNASGVDLTTTIFGGSEFPGSVGYSLAYNSDGNYGVPGLANYVTHGNSNTFSVGWSENIPDVPTVSAAFQMGSSNYTVYGANDEGNNKFRTVNLHSSYRLAGFNFGEYYSIGNSNSLIPEVLSGETTATTQSGDDSYGFNVTHRLPMSGSISGGFNRSSWNSSFGGETSSGTIDLMNVQAGMHPWEKVTFSAGADYSDNLNGQLVQQILAAGGVAPGINLSQASNSLDLMGVGTYSPSLDLQGSFSVERRTQSYSGQNYGVTSYTVSTTYARETRLGSFNSSVSATDNTDDQTGDNTLGFTATESYAGEFKDWKVNANFSYAQNAQTLLVTYMNSFYNYSLNTHRRWGKLNIGAGAAASRTALTDQAGTENDSQSFNAIAGYGHWINMTGTYARAHGQALATGAGLIPVPIPSPVLPSSLLDLYGGDSYGFGMSTSPVDKLVFTASYSRSLSNTSGGEINSQNENDQYNALLQYQTRKLTFVSGYARLGQGFSAAGVPPQIVVSYYAGISRWFNFF